MMIDHSHKNIILRNRPSCKLEKDTMFRFFFLALLSTLSNGLYIEHSPKLTNEQEAFIEAWGSFAEDYDALKNLHHPDVTVLACCFPAECKEYEGYDSAFLHYKAVAQEYNSFIVTLTSQSDVLTM